MGAIAINNGDVVKTTCSDYMACWHKAVALLDPDGWHLYECTPGSQNEYGGSVFRTPAAEFFAGRQLLSVQPLGLDADCVRQYAWENRGRKWHALSYNCEDFVSEIVQGNKGSSLRNLYAAGISALIVLFLKKVF